VAESKLEKLRKIKKQSPINMVMVALVVGFVILIACQLLFFDIEMQERTQTTSTVQGSTSVMTMTL